MNPVLFEIGPLTIRWYGVMIATACILGIWFAGKEAERKGLDKKIIQDFSLYAIIGAIIGARFYYVAFEDGFLFFKNPLSLFAIWQGGLAIHGGILGGSWSDFFMQGNIKFQ
jgi:phosphatidylglycerol:prolipoprotein diacylglycerol transferase